jgi:peptide/nickel transport system substrate-binding protein
MTVAQPGGAVVHKEVRMSWQRSFQIGSLFAALAVLLAACAPAAPPSPARAPAQARSGLETLRLGTEDYGYPQPYTFSRGPGHVLTSYVFDTLIWHDANGLIPWLAADWKVVEDGVSWRFNLRQDVKWHDGKPFTAEDVVFSFQYLKEKANPWWASSLELVEKVEASGDHAVTIRTTRPYAPFLTSIAASVLIFPKHIWSGVAEPKQFLGPEATIGTGPYRLKQYDKAQGTYLFEANPDFFLGRPYVQRLELVPAPNELIALQQGAIDAGGAGTQDVPTDEVLAPFKDSGKFGTLSAPREWTVGLFFNQARGGALADVQVRRAVAHTINHQDLVERVLHGKGAPGKPAHVSPTSPWHNPSAPQYAHDPARARQLLESAGYVDRDGDGVREGPDGKPLSFELLFSSGDSARNPELLKSYLQAVGIGITPRALDRNTRDSAATDGRYELVLVGFGGLGGDPDGLRGKFHSKSPARSFTRAQGYANPRFDELADRQLTETDETRRKQMVDEMQVLLAQDLPMLSLYYPDETWIYRKGTVEDWYFAYGWYGGGTNGSYKHLFVTGQKTGTSIKGR